MSEQRTALINQLADHIGVSRLTEQETDAILDLAGAAAHGTGDRTSAPLVSFLAGVAAAGNGDRRTTVEGLREQTGAIAPKHD